MNAPLIGWIVASILLAVQVNQVLLPSHASPGATTSLLSRLRELMTAVLFAIYGYLRNDILFQLLAAAMVAFTMLSVVIARRRQAQSGAANADPDGGELLMA